MEGVNWHGYVWKALIGVGEEAAVVVFVNPLVMLGFVFKVQSRADEFEI